MKRPLTIFALLGLVGCFLPLIAGISFFELRHAEWFPVVLMVAAFAVPTFVSLSSADAPAALVGLLGFGYVVFRFNTGLWDLLVHGEIGGKMMAVGAVGGLVSSLGLLAGKKKA